MLDRNLVFAGDTKYSHTSNNARVAYKYSKWEDYGYLDYVTYSDWLNELVSSGELTEEERSAVVGFGRTKAQDSEQVSEYVKKFTDNPIQMDVVYASSSEVFTNRANSLKQSIEASTQGLVQVNLIAAADNTDWYYSGYYMNYGYEMNYDFCDLSGWGPDYGDPASYLDTFQPEYAGYMIKSIGIY